MSDACGPARATKRRWVVFDLDGTLVDSDRALITPFLRLGVSPERVTLGPLLVDQCAELGIAVDDYLALYDSDDVAPFAGVEEMLLRVPRWAVCSNKVRRSGEDELARFGWKPAYALFAEDFGGRPKHLGPVLAHLAIDAADVLFVGDTDHDRSCARDAGVAFALAGWNPRAIAEVDDIELDAPADVFRYVLAD